MPGGPGLWSQRGKGGCSSQGILINGGSSTAGPCGLPHRCADLGAFALDFGALPVKKRTWRDAPFHDWELRLGSQTYPVHRIILAEGERMSHFFLAQFEHWEHGSPVTDLATLLPEPCWPSWETTLDYVYDGDISMDASNVVRLLKIAHVLQIPALGALAMDCLRCSLSRETAPAILASALELSPGFELLIEECTAIIAREFDTYAAGDFVIFPSEIMVCVLRHPQLWASPKHVSHSVAAYIRALSEGPPEESGVLKDTFEKFVPYLQDVQPEDALYLLHTAVELQHAECRAACLRCAVQNFAALDTSELTLIKDLETVIELLDSDELATKDEDIILEAILQYIHARSDLTKDELEEVWATCRFSDLSLTAWENLLALDQAPSKWVQLGMLARLVRSEKGEAEYEAFVAKHAGLAGKRLQRRRKQHEVYFLHFSSPFDENGVLYWIGTQGRTRKYMNPCKSGDVSVAFSKRGTGDVSCFVQHSNTSQECHTDEMPDAWMQVDLGKGRSLRANYYCLRHGLRLNEYCLRSWELQGSNDGLSWTLLHERFDDMSLTGGGFTTAAWPLEPPGRSSYRLFRILQTGPSHSTCSDNLRVACAGIELYGDLFQAR